MSNPGMPKGEVASATDLAWLLANTPHAIIRNDLEGNFLYASGAAAEIFGREPDELNGSALELLDPADVEAAAEKLASLIERGVGSEDQITARVCHPDGSRVWADFQGRLVADSAGELSVVSVVRPSGDRVEAQRALARVEERYRELVEWLPAIVYESKTGPAGLFLYVSPQIEDMLGFTPEEWMADADIWLEQVHPDDRDRMVEEEDRLEHQARGTDKRIMAEYRMHRRDGEVVWIRDVARLCESDGSIPFWRGVLIDITAEHSAQEALESAQQRHRSMVDSLPACVYRAEPRAVGRWEYVSTQIESLLGYKPAEWRADATLWRASLHADDRERVEREEEEHASATPGTEFVSEYRLRHRNGRVVWIRDRAVVTRNLDGDPMIDGILTDITAERAAEAGAGILADVYRLSCNDCGAAWAAEQIEPCRQCGGRDIEGVSMNAALNDLAAARRQVEGLLDGIQRHLEALGTNLRSVSARIAADAPTAESDS